MSIYLPKLTTIDTPGADQMVLAFDSNGVLTVKDESANEYSIPTLEDNNIWTGTNVFGDGSGPENITVNGGVSSRDIIWQSDGSDRWKIRVNSSAESGSEAGSNFALVPCDDTGAENFVALYLFRASGHLSINATGDVAQLYAKADAAATIGLVLNTAASPSQPVMVLQNNGTDRLSTRLDYDEFIYDTILNYSLADTGIIDLPNAVGVLEVINSSNADYGLFLIRGSANAVVTVADATSAFSTTKGNSGTINVYYESSAYHIENQLGGTRSFAVRLTRGSNAA